LTKPGDRLIADHQSPRSQEILDIPIAQGEPKIEPDRKRSPDGAHWSGPSFKDWPLSGLGPDADTAVVGSHAIDDGDIERCPGRGRASHVDSAAIIVRRDFAEHTFDDRRSGGLDKNPSTDTGVVGGNRIRHREASRRARRDIYPGNRKIPDDSVFDGEVSPVLNRMPFVTLPGVVTSLKEEHENSASRMFSNDRDCLAPHVHSQRAKGSVRPCRREMTLDVESVVGGCMS
jgi:hypothetical protein